MSKYFKTKQPKLQIDFTNVACTMKSLYFNKLLPLEKTFRYNEVHSPPLSEAYFDAKPMVLLIGQYSTGKTTFIRHLLGEDFPDIRIGPEPTTDRFIIVMNSEKAITIPGNVVVVDKMRQFQQLATFGNNFLNKFQCSCLPNEVLESLTFIDTPGVLSGDKQKLDRGYNFFGVVEYLCNLVDRIILVFDPHKLDISDEFRQIIEGMKENENKIRIVLNKAGTVDQQKLIRVFGALMWNLGKLFKNPEVPPVYMGSFWDQPLQYDSNRELFNMEQEDLFADLKNLPKYSAIQKLNDLIRRTRSVMMHAHIIGQLHSEMPSVLGKGSKKKELLTNLPQLFERIAQKHSLSDLPPVQKMRAYLQNQDFRKFSGPNPKLMAAADSMLKNDVPRLLELIQRDQNSESLSCRTTVSGGVFQKAMGPFDERADEGVNRGMKEESWIVESVVPESYEIFKKLNPPDGRMSGEMARTEMRKSHLPDSTLSQIWALSDVDKDSFLSADEFSLARYLIRLKLDGYELPKKLPFHLYPPSSRPNTVLMD